MSKLKLKDESTYELESYTNIDTGMKLVIKDLAYSDISKFSDDNLSTVEVISDLDETVAVFSNVTLGSQVSIDSEKKTIELSIVDKDVKSQVEALKAQVEELQNQVNEMQAQVSSLTTEEKEAANIISD